MKNIAVIGYGDIGKRVADAVSLLEDMKLTGVCDVISDQSINKAISKGQSGFSATEEDKT